MFHLNKTYNARAISLIDKAGITTKEFCRRTEINPNQVTQVRNGNRSFTVEQIIKIAVYFKTDANWILGLTDVNRKLVRKVL